MADPVLWLKTDKPYAGAFRRARVWNEQTKAYETPTYERGHAMAGRPVLERIPASGFDGSDIRNMRPMRGKRFIEVMRHDGHEVFIPITNAAAHQPQEDRSCETDRRLKARWFAWIERGKCPAMMMAAGELPAEKIASDTSKDKRWATPCHPQDVGPGKPPCHHYLAEKKARTADNDARMSDVEEKYESEAAKHIKELRDLNTTIGEAVKKALLSGNATGGASK